MSGFSRETLLFGRRHGSAHAAEERMIPWWSHLRYLRLEIISQRPDRGKAGCRPVTHLRAVQDWPLDGFPVLKGEETSVDLIRGEIALADGLVDGARVFV